MTDHPSTSEAPEHYLQTDIPSSNLGSDEHDGHGESTHAKHDYVEKEKGPADDEEEDEDIDALIEELESEDAGEDEEEDAGPGMSAKPVPEELLNTDTRKGLTSHEVTERRKRYGLNQMAEEKENLFKKFLMYFVGPIQFVMEVYYPHRIRSELAV